MKYYFGVFFLALTLLVPTEFVWAGTGNVSVNGTCADQNSCISGAYCDIKNTSTPVPKCAVKKGKGEVCVDNFECVSSTCTSGKCIMGKSKVGGYCTSADTCDEKLYCDLKDKTDILPHCRETKAAGTACVDNYECISNICKDGKCTDPSIAKMTNNSVATNTVTQKPPVLNALSKVCPLTPVTYQVGDTASIPWIAQCIQGAFKYSLLMGSLLAVLMMIIGGVMYIISGVNPGGVATAKKMITNPLYGLVILLTSYIILNTINPDLVSLNSVSVQSIAPTEDSIPTNGFDNNGSSLPDGTAAVCANDSQLVSIGDGKRLLQISADGLKRAKDIAVKKGKEIQVVSADRSMAKQQKLWDEALAIYHGDEAQTRKIVAKPSCNSTHVSGNAIDLCLKGTASCGKIKGAYANYTDADVQLLQQIMKEAGALRYCGEWWHFEFGLPNMPARCSP